MYTCQRLLLSVKNVEKKKRSMQLTAGMVTNSVRKNVIGNGRKDVLGMSAEQKNLSIEIKRGSVKGYCCMTTLIGVAVERFIGGLHLKSTKNPRDVSDVIQRGISMFTIRMAIIRIFHLTISKLFVEAATIEFIRRGMVEEGRRKSFWGWD